MKETIRVIALLLVGVGIGFAQADLTFTITLPVSVSQDVLDAFAHRYSRPESVVDPASPDPANPVFITNPETKEAFFIRQVETFVRETYRSTVVQKSADEAASTARSAKNTETEGKSKDIKVTKKP